MMWNLIDMINILDIETILEKQTSTAKMFVTYKTKRNIIYIKANQSIKINEIRKLVI